MQSKKELRYLPAKELRVQNTKEGQTISGYAIVFDSKSVNLGGFVETVSRSAVTKTLSGKPDILLLRDHNPSIVLGRSLANTLTITTDDTGVFFRCLLPQTTQAADLAVSISRGDVSGCSFSFICEEDEWSQDSNGGLLRNLRQISVSELSVVSFPAYPETNVRSCPLELRNLLDDDDEEDDGEDNDDCQCDEEDGEECRCHDEDDDEDESDFRSTWAEMTLLRIEVARRK